MAKIPKTIGVPKIFRWPNLRQGASILIYENGLNGQTLTPNNTMLTKIFTASEFSPNNLKVLRVLVSAQALMESGASGDGNIYVKKDSVQQGDTFTVSKFDASNYGSFSWAFDVDSQGNTISWHASGSASAKCVVRNFEVRAIVVRI